MMSRKKPSFANILKYGFPSLEAFLRSSNTKTILLRPRSQNASFLTTQETNHRKSVPEQSSVGSPGKPLFSRFSIKSRPAHIACTGRPLQG